jgi:nucleotide-binding universal stress UspA family protein
MYKRILVPVDGSPCSERAARLACRLARVGEAGIVFTHVLRERGQRAGGEEASARARSLGTALLERWERICSDCVPSSARLVEGAEVAAVIVQTAHSEGCDLIAMGTHGREGLPRLLLGSVAERVSRLSGAPVLLVRASRERSEERLAIGQIVVAVDGSEPGNLALDHAIDLARSLSAGLTIVHAVGEPVVPIDVMGVYLDAGAQATYEKMRTLGERILREAKERAIGLEANTLLLQVGQQRVGDAIAAFADDVQADLVVLGTHGRTGLDRWLLGSVAERVAHRATVPTLLVRSGGAPAHA